MHKAGEDEVYRKMEDLPFFKLQKKIVLRNCGIIDPGNIEEYIARDGYSALAKCLGEMTPQQVIDEIKKPPACAVEAAADSPPALNGSSPRTRKGDREVRPLQRRRGRPRRVHGPQRPRGRPALRDRGHDHRRLRHRRAPGLRLRPSGVSAGYRAAHPRDPAGPRVGLPQPRHPRHRFRVRPRHPHRRGRVRLRRGDRADGLHRGQARRAEAEAAVPRDLAAFGRARRCSTTSKPTPTSPGSS